MPDLITRCPQCATAFRISDTLLKSAKGKVRCGSCLEVFDATAHLQSRTTLVPPQAPNTIQPHSQPISITGFLKRQDGSVETGEEPAGRSDARTPSPADGGDLFERRAPAASAPPADHDDLDLDPDDDEAWALELLKDDSDLNVQFKKIVTRPLAVPTQTDPPAQEAPPPDPQEPEQDLELDNLPITDADPTENNDIPVDLDELLAEIETTTEETISSGDNEQPPEVSPTTEEVQADSGQHRQEEPPPATEGVDTFEEPAPKEPEVRASAGAERPMREAIAAIEPEPLEVDWDPSPSWKKRLLWPLLALIALVALLGQVAWLEFHRLNTVEPYRSFYAVACRYLQCTLPELVDRGKIQTSNLVVRSHPDVEHALMVDVILQNNAQFEQPFPTLLLTFADLHNQPVASRRLTPDDYLGGELAGSDSMPVNQPIHIGIEIADPGEEAVSYSIAIVD